MDVVNGSLGSSLLYSSNLLNKTFTKQNIFDFYFNNYCPPLFKRLTQNCLTHTTVTSLKCYQCSADKTIDCSDLMIIQPDAQIQPEECDSVHDAKYCIKSTALNG